MSPNEASHVVITAAMKVHSLRSEPGSSKAPVTHVSITSSLKPVCISNTK